MNPSSTFRAAPRITVPGPEEMRLLGRRLAALLRPGDLVLLSGELGAGKTTLTRGIGEGLGVRGAVTSPTFVIARVHPPLGDGPPLVHADAYRLGGGLEEMEDLDLDAALPESVVVVEWGEDKVEELSADRLHVRIERSRGADRGGPGGGTADGQDTGGDGGHGAGGEGGESHAAEAEPRTVVLTPAGPRWHGAAAGLAAVAER